MPPMIAGVAFEQEQPCHPEKPDTPAIVFMMKPLMGPPTKPAMGMPTKNSAQTCEREFAGKPVGQIQHDARIETGFRNTEQEARREKLRRRGDEPEQTRNDSPHHRMREIHNRAPKRVQQQIARNLAGRVADKENAGAKPEHGIGQPDIGAHLQLCKADVHTIQKRNDVENEEKRNELPGGAIVSRHLVIRIERSAREKLEPSCWALPGLPWIGWRRCASGPLRPRVVRFVSARPASDSPMR